MKAIVILGQMLNDDGSMVSILKRRLDKALLLRSDNSLFIVVGGRANKKSPFSEAQVMYNYLLSKGVSQKNIVKEERSLDTIGNVFFLKRDILKKKRINDLVVVTSSFHVPRARIIFSKILGPSYNVSFVSSHDFFDLLATKLVISGIEKKLTAIIADMLNNIDSGNDKKISSMLKSHPFYSKKGFGNNDVKKMSDKELADLLGVREVSVRPIRKYLDARISQTK
jgi:hypothetical protein